MDDDTEYGQIWGDPIEVPPRLNTQGSFNVYTKEEIRAPHKDEYASVQKKKKPLSPSPIDINVFLLKTETDKLKGVVELSSLHNGIVENVKTRIVCLFDTSGSMLLKCGRSRKDSKLKKLRKMAVDLVDALEDNEDYLGLVTFGEEANVAVPLTTINSFTREGLKKCIHDMNDKLSTKTDLMDGLLTAIDLLTDPDPKTKHLYRNAIIVFSDGEINKGITSPDDIIPEIRKKIRAAKSSDELPSDQWLSISCVTTGGNVSEALYRISKFCGNDAYYYIDSKASNPELDMMVPLMLRKFSVGQFLNLKISTGSGAELDTRSCSQEHTIRRKRQSTSEEDQISYYLFDFPAGQKKHFSIALDIESFHKRNAPYLLSIKLQFVDNEGNLRTVSKNVELSDIVTEDSGDQVYDDALVLLAKSDMRQALQATCRKSSDFLVQDENAVEEPKAALTRGKTEISKLRESYLSKAKLSGTKSNVEDFEREVNKNLDKLIEMMEKSIQGGGHKWTKMKAVSSAIIRETPNVANLVSGKETLCPLPTIRDCASNRIAALAMKIYHEQDSNTDLMDTFGNRLHDAASQMAESLGSLISKLNEVSPPS